MNMPDEEDNYTSKNESFASFSRENASESSPVIYDTDEEFVEQYTTEVKIAFVTLACVSAISSIAAISFMHRSKNIPYATRFLSTGLLLFDLLFIVTSTVRKFITDHVTSLNIQTFVTIYLQLALFTVGLMSLERYFLILKPMWYSRLVRKKFVRTTVLCIWLFEFCLSLVVRYGVCYIRYRSILAFTKASFCNSIMSSYYGTLLIIVLGTSCTCYVKIFKCIRSKLTPGSTLSAAATARVLRSYRSTSLVFLYLIVIIASSVAYGVIIILIKVNDLRHTRLRLAMEAVSILNCILDPFLYVLWFKECRMKLLTLIGVFLKRYRQKAEQMRIEVYNIVTTEMRCYPIAQNTSIKVSHTNEAFSENPNDEINVSHM